MPVKFASLRARFNNPKEVIPCLVRFLGFQCVVSVPAGTGEALSNDKPFYGLETQSHGGPRKRPSLFVEPFWLSARGAADCSSAESVALLSSLARRVSQPPG